MKPEFIKFKPRKPMLKIDWSVNYYQGSHINKRVQWEFGNQKVKIVYDGENNNLYDAMTNKWIRVNFNKLAMQTIYHISIKNNKLQIEMESF